MKPRLKSLPVLLLTGLIAGFVTSCSQDLPITPPDGLAAAPGVSLAVIPTNDDFDNPVVITAIPFRHSVNTSEATIAEDDPVGFENCIEAGTVWYRFTPIENIRINANTIGSNFDTGIAVFTGTRGDLTPITCNDALAGGGHPSSSSLTFDALAGETYFFMVGGAFAFEPGGNLVFNVDFPVQVGLTIDRVGSVSRSTGLVSITGTVTCSGRSFVELGGAVRQRKVFASQGSLFTSFDCDVVTRWQAEVAGENGRFKPGPAEVSAGALFYAPNGELVHTSTSMTVRLRPRK